MLPHGVPRHPRRCSGPGRRPPRRGCLQLAGGARTTVHVACHDADRTEIRVVVLPGQERTRALVRAARRRRGAGRRLLPPAGRAAARRGAHPRRPPRARPVDAPWHAVRAALHVEGGAARIARRDALDAEPRGDLLQAGPLLVADATSPTTPRPTTRASARRAPVRPEPHRRPPPARRHRARAGADPRRRLRRPLPRDAGLTLFELACLMVALGCEQRSTSTAAARPRSSPGGRLQNLPRRAFEEIEPGGRPVSTALEFRPVARV